MSFQPFDRWSLALECPHVGSRSALPRAVFRAVISLILFLHVLDFNTAAAQPEDLQFRHVAIQAGLPSGVITSILQDNQGFLWFGTSKGLGRYDGYAFHVPRDTTSPGGDFVYALYRDGSTFIWIATIGAGLKRYDPVRDVVVQYKHDAADPNSVRSDSVYSVFRDHAGQLWVGTLRGLDRFDSSRQAFVHVFPDPRSSADSFPNQVTSITEYAGQPEVLWLGMLGGGLVRYDCRHSTAKRYLHSDRAANSLSNNAVRFVCEDRTVPLVLWIGTEGGGLNRFDVSHQKFTWFRSDMEPPPRYGFDYIRSMYQDHAGSIWLGTRGGLSRFNPATGEFVHYENNPLDPGSIVNGHINAIYEDQNGTFWVGTRGGLDRFSPGSGRMALYRHDPSSLRNDYMKTVYEDKVGTLWVGNAEGILHRVDKNNGTCDAFAILDDARNDFDKIVLSVLEDREGTFWVGTDEGLYVFDRITGVHHGVLLSPPADGGREPPHVTSLYEDRRCALWVGTRDDGLIRYDRNTLAAVSYRHDDADPHSVSRGLITYIHEDQGGTLWVTTSGGLNRFDAESGKFFAFTTADGLPDNSIYGFVQDNAGNFWLSTDKGLCRFNPATGRCKNFGLEDGLQGMEFNFHSFCMCKSGRMYLGGNLGLNTFYPDSLSDNSHIPPVVVTMIKAFDREVRADTALPYLTTITLPYHENYLSFEFSALDFKDPSKNLYAYTLAGLDRDWIHCGTRRYTTYSNLEAGTYVFKVRGSNNDGVWNEQGSSISIVITPPFWKTWWFNTLFFVTILATVGGTVRFFEKRKLIRRIEQLEHERALERERARISQDMHDEVGARLTEIGILSELVKKEIVNPEKALSQAQRISETSREVIANIGEIIWAMNPTHDRLDDLVAYLRQYTSRYLEPTGIQCRFEFPDEVPTQHFTAEERRNLFLVAKEVLNNAVKHSGASEVIMRIVPLEGSLEIRIEDNGYGFDMTHPSRFGNGLRNMEKRMSDIGGTFSLHSERGKGTCVEMRAHARS